MNKPTDLYAKPFSELTADDLNVIQAWAALSGDPDALVPDGTRLVTVTEYKQRRGLLPAPADSPGPAAAAAVDNDSDNDNSGTDTKPIKETETKWKKPALTPQTRPGN
jgi:hypothetical protein